MRAGNSVCYLEGNVTGKKINLSWSHFLEGFNNPTNGENVGLHEMAHALYYQHFIVDENSDRPFQQQYDVFLQDSNRVYNLEKNRAGGLYSEYALKNMQEFWAESVEIFFEKPFILKTTYPGLYASISHLLNQDPAIFQEAS
jgi:Mlc titration factor MtfA (ptsG expression regulator)